MWAMPASLSVAAVLPLATSSQPRSERPWASSTRPSLSYTDSRALTTSSPALLLVSSPDSAESHVRPPARPAPRPPWPGTAARSTTLIRSCSVSSVSPARTGTASWARIGPASISSVARCTVHPRLGHAGGQGVAHAVPARERRQQGGVGVQDPAGKGPVHGLGHHGPEAGHGHEVDLVGHQRGRHGGREPVAVEPGPKPPKPVRSTSSAAAPCSSARARAAQGRSDRTTADRETRLEHGLAGSSRNPRQGPRGARRQSSAASGDVGAAYQLTRSFVSSRSATLRARGGRTRDASAGASAAHRRGACRYTVSRRGPGPPGRRSRAAAPRRGRAAGWPWTASCRRTGRRSSARPR